MKKFICVFLCISILMVCVACGSDENATTQNAVDNKETETVVNSDATKENVTVTDEAADTKEAVAEESEAGKTGMGGEDLTNYQNLLDYTLFLEEEVIRLTGEKRMLESQLNLMKEELANK